jgi:ATP-binding cassette, subfamily B, bacterial HlyB/CyaB
MDGGQPTSSISDPGLAALVMLLRFQGVGIDPEQIRHQFGGIPIGVPEMLRCAKGFGLKARSVTTKWERLAGMPLIGPATSAVQKTAIDGVVL